MGPELELSALALEVQRLRERVDTLERTLQAHEPILPMYTLAQACALLPTLPTSLMHLLARKRALFDAPMYRRGPRHRRYRMLSHRDLLTARRLLLRTTAQRKLRDDAAAVLAA